MAELSAWQRRRLLIDVTQYANQPATTGIQRLLGHLARDWPGEALDARFGFIDSGRYVTGPISSLGSVIEATFRSANPGLSVRPEIVRKPLYAAASETIRVDDIERAFGAYLLPEPTFREQSVDVAMRLHASKWTTPFFVYHDALPLTHPQFFPHDFSNALEHFNRAVVTSENVAFTSRAGLRVVESRLARRKLANAIVALPGADGLPRVRPRTPSRPTFTMLGSVEPRKRHEVVLDAFERLWAAGRNYLLLVHGVAGWEQPEVIERLRILSRTPQVEWTENPRDDDIAAAFSQSSAVLYPSRAEGYGLPPVEALAAGCPVIATADLPSLEELSPAGQVRLECVTAETIASAVESLAAPDTNAAYRHAIRELRLPTWKEFAATIERWIAGVLAPCDRPGLTSKAHVA